MNQNKENREKIMSVMDAQLSEERIIQYRKENRFWNRYKRNKAAVAALAVLLIIILSVIFADILTPYDNYKLDLTHVYLKPGEQNHILGTDEVGRDLLTRILNGGRVSLTVALISLIMGMTLGTILGMIAGYMGGFFDNLIMRIMDGMSAFPTILLSLLLMTVFGAGIVNMIIAMTIGSIPRFARISRGLISTEVKQDYVISEQSLGASRYQIIFHHILPNIFSTILVYGTLNIGNAIISEASLSFLGLGVPLPTASWGNILQAGKTVIETQPHISVFSGLMIVITVMCFNLIGNGVRDALDHKMK